MKRSRIFLGATSALLAIAGIAAAKMSNFTSTVTRYYCTQLGTTTKQICVTFAQNASKPSAHFTSVTGVKTFYFTVNTSKYTLYTDGNVNSIGVGCNSSSGCKQPLTYSVLQ